jgi:hypothetical protein
MLTEPDDSDDYIFEQGNYYEALGMMSYVYNKMTIEDMTLLDWFIKNTDEGDWAAFLSEYNIFATVNDEKKQWSSKRIRSFRRCLRIDEVGLWKNI